MATTARKSRQRRPTAQRCAAEKAEEVAKALHSFAGTLKALDALAPGAGEPIPTPRKWWRLQAGRSKGDPTFAEFVAEVQAARKREG